jgi:capsular exopolysaccharide synthesis family protein
MSKNFELMQEALRDAPSETLGNQEPAKVVFLESERDGNGHHSSAFDNVAQQECFKLVQRLFLGQPQHPFRVVVFAGVDRGNGCSRICAEVARILAANVPGSVCLVDANLRTPTLSVFFGVSTRHGLVNSLLEEGTIRSFVKQVKSSNLWLLPAGPHGPDSPSLLNSDQLRTRVQELRNEFEYILIDTPALNPYSDAITLGRIADGAVIVLQADSTRRESALTSLQALRQSHIEVLGAVLNRRTFPIPGFVYRRL